MWPLIVLLISGAIAEDSSSASSSSGGSFERDDPLENYDDDMRPFIHSLEDEIGTHKMLWDDDKKIIDPPEFPYNEDDEYMDPVKLKMSDLDWLEGVTFSHVQGNGGQVDMRLPILPLDKGVRKTISIKLFTNFFDDDPLQNWVEISEGGKNLGKAFEFNYDIEDYLDCVPDNNIWVGMTICFRPREYKYRFFLGVNHSVASCFEIFWPSLKFGANICFLYTEGGQVEFMNKGAYLTLYESGDLYSPKTMMITQLPNRKWAKVPQRML